MGVLTVAVVGGCGQGASSAPEADGAAPAVSDVSPAGAVSSAPSPHSAAGPPWYSVAGGAPEISGAVRKTTGPLADQEGIDHAGRFQRAWAYTGRVLLVSVDINRADPAADKCGDMREIASGTRSVGHLVVTLRGIGDGGTAILDKAAKGVERPVVRTYACSGNAIVSVIMHVGGVITDEADLTARSSELTAVLDEVLADLRPR